MIKKLISFAFVIIMIITSSFVLHAENNKILHRGNGTEPDTLDPHLASGSWEGNIINDLFIGLYTKDEHGAPIEGSALDYKKSSNGLVYNFYLRKDHFWSDGEKVTAHDYVEGFKRVMNPETASQYASLLYLIKNAKEINTGKLDVNSLGVKALNDYELEIILNYPAPYLIELLSHYTTYPIPRHIFNKFGKDWIKPQNLQTNGPYTLFKWRPHDNIHLKRNDLFYDNKNVWFDEVIFYPIDDNEAALRKFRTGELDINNGYPENKSQWLKKNMPKKN